MAPANYMWHAWTSIDRELLFVWHSGVVRVCVVRLFVWHGGVVRAPVHTVVSVGVWRRGGPVDCARTSPNQRAQPTRILGQVAHAAAHPSVLSISDHKIQKLFNKQTVVPFFSKY